MKKGRKLTDVSFMEHNIEEFKRVDKTRFRSDNFIDGIEFDYLEIHVIEED